MTVAVVGKKRKYKNPQGRPPVYDRVVVGKWLRAYAGQRGGLDAAWRHVRREKGHRNITKVTCWLIARDLGIRFGVGKPTVEPTMMVVK